VLNGKDNISSLRTFKGSLEHDSHEYRSEMARRPAQNGEQMVTTRNEHLVKLTHENLVNMNNKICLQV
jgi:hypothetical protein